jgi:hypothetical protein
MQDIPIAHENIVSKTNEDKRSEARLNEPKEYTAPVTGVESDTFIRERDISTRPWKEAMLSILFLGPFFFISYGIANWISTLRNVSESFYFDWEKNIPVIPAMIVPYMSIDLFFTVIKLTHYRCSYTH